tara:strand:- start:359 stop:922 length:564 start_codon:yes stop_codon:yes gene_type:complete
MEPADIRARIVQQGLTIAELARRVGMDQNKLSKSLGGTRQLKVPEMDSLREFFAQQVEQPLLRAIPIIGQVVAGNWREAVQHPLGSIPQPDPSMPPRSFALQVNGDSMDLYVDEGGTVIIDPDDRQLYPGKFYVIINDEGEATFKQFKADPARLVPCSTNSSHREIQIGDGNAFEVVGRVIWRASRM